MLNKIAIAAEASREVYRFRQTPRTYWFSRNNVKGFIQIIYPGIALISLAGSDDWMDWRNNFIVGKSKLGLHQGWLKSYMQVKDVILQKLHELEVVEIWVTGHSAGGAIASITALFLAKRYENISLITFSQPKFGCKSAVGRLEGKLKTYIRVGHYLDPVPYLPPLGGYRHGGTSVKLWWWGDPHRKIVVPRKIVGILKF